MDGPFFSFFSLVDSSDSVQKCGWPLLLLLLWTQGTLGAAVTFATGLLGVDSWGGTTAAASFGSGAATSTATLNLRTYDQAQGTISNLKNAQTSSWGAVNMANTILASLSTFGFDGVQGLQKSLNGAVVASAVHDVTATVEAWKDAVVSGTKVLSSNIQSFAKNVAVVAYDELQSQLSAFGYGVAMAINKLEVNMATGQWFFGLSFGEVVNSNINVSGNLSLYALGNIEGTFNSTGALVTIEGTQIYGGSISGQTADVSAWANLSSAVAGTDSAKVFAHGNVSQTVTSSAGTVEINASGNITQTVSGVKGVKLDAIGDVTQAVTSSEGEVSINAGSLQSTANVDGRRGVEIQSWGLVGGSVTSLKGPVKVFAAGDVDGEINGNGDVAVDTWGNVKKSITAGYEILPAPPPPVGLTDEEKAATKLTVTALGDIESAATLFSTGSVQVQVWGKSEGVIIGDKGTVDVDAYGNLTGDVTGELQTDVTVWGNIGGSSMVNIESRSSAVTVSSYGKTYADVVGGTTATATAGGEFDGSVQSTNGDASLTAQTKVAQYTVVIALKGNAEVDSFGEAKDIYVQATSAPTTDNPALYSASVSALGELSGTVLAHNDVSVFGKDNVNLTATTTVGSITVLSGGTLEGTYNAGLGLSATSQGNAKGSYTAGGAASLDTLGTLGAGTASSVKAQKDVHVFAQGGVLLTTIESLTASISVLAGGAITAGTLKGDVNASVVGLGGIEGTVTATKGSASVSVRGVLDATVKAKQNVDVLASDQILKSITATDGNADVVTFANLTGTGTVTAGTNASVVVQGDSVGNISAGRDADVMVLGKLIGNVGAGNDANVVTHGDLNGDVTAVQNVSAVVFAQQNGNVVAGHDADVYVTGKLVGDVDANNDAEVWSFDDITGKTDAGRNADVTTWHQITGAVTAGNNAEVWAYDTLGGTISAGQDATATSWTMATSTTTAVRHATVTVYGSYVAGAATNAGDDASVTAYGPLQGTVTAGDDASAWSLGSLTGNVTAGGDATVESVGSLTNVIIAGGKATLWGVGTIIGNVTADSIDVTGHAAVAGFFNATSGAELFALGPVIGNISVTNGSANVSTLANAGPLMVSGTSASVLADGSATSVSVTATNGSASLIGLSAVNSSSVSAPNGVASVSSLGSVAIVTVSGKAASLSSFSSVSFAGLSAEHFASLFAGGSVVATSLTTTSGSVSALVQGTVGSLSLNAASDAVLSSLGTIISANLTAGHSASLFSVGSATATLTAPEIVQGVGYSTLDVAISGAPKLLEVMSTGTLTLTGSADVARVATFGDYSASSSLTVKQLTLLWVLGDLAGSVTADQIGGVRVFDNLIGTVIETGVPLVYSPPSPPNNGYYMPTGEDGMLFYPYSLVTPLNFHGTGASGVQVLHDITSSATVTLANPFAVTAGGTILGSVTAFTTSAGDRSSFQEQPEIPFAEVGEILADIRDSANSLTDMHDQLVSAGASLVQATAAALAELSNTLASAQAQVTTEQLDALEKMLSLKVEESVRLIASLDAGNRALNNATVDIAGASRQAAALLLIELAKLADAKLARQTELNVGYGAATDERSLQNTLRTLTQAAHSDNLTLILAIRNSAAAQRPDAWYEAANNALATAGSLAVDLVQLALSVVGAEQTIVGGIANGLNALISYARGDYYGAALDVAAAWPGAGAGHDAAGLARAFGRVGRTFGRFGRSVVNTAAAVNRRLDCHDANRLFSLMGKVLGRCFVGDTLVLIGEFELGQTVALIDPELSSTAPPLIAHEATAEADSSRWGWATMFLVVGVTGAILSRNRRRATISALRLPKPRVNLDPVDDPLPPPLTPEELTALCDELFSPTSDSVPRPSGSGQGSRHVPRDESRTPSDAHSPMTTSPRNRTSPSSSNMLALAEEPIMRYEPHQLAQPATTPRPSRARNIFASVWFTFFGLLAAWNFFGPTPQPATKHVVALPVIAAKTETPPALFQVTAEPKPRFAAKAIRDIHPIADRVIAKNPEQQKEVVKPIVEVTESELAELEATLMALADNDPLPALIDGVDDNAELVAFNSSEVIDEAPDAEPTKAETLANELLQAAQAGGGEIEWTDYGPFVRENWRVIHFLLTRPDGDLVRIWLARPTWWLEAEQVKAGGKYEFDMEEVGAVGMADVLSIDECQEPPRRQNEHHRLVTGKFEHEATNVIDLYVEGQDEPIGTTANHPFWSADRQAFVEAASLRPGENLLNAEGHRIQVVTHSARPGPQAVFNLEVDGTHVYHVSRTGCLVHNQCPLFGKKAFNTKIHHLVSYFGNKLRGFAANWSQKSQKILKAAGIDPKNSKWNQMHVPNHKGPHPQKYHKAVYERLKKAVEGKTPGSNGYQVAVRVALIKFARDLKNAKYRRSIGL